MLKGRKVRKIESEAHGADPRTELAGKAVVASAGQDMPVNAIDVALEDNPVIIVAVIHHGEVEPDTIRKATGMQSVPDGLELTDGLLGIGHREGPDLRKGTRDVSVHGRERCQLSGSAGIHMTVLAQGAQIVLIFFADTPQKLRAQTGIAAGRAVKGRGGKPHMREAEDKTV